LLMSNPTGRGEAWHWCRRRPGRVAAGRQGAGRGGLPAGQERAELGDGAHQRAAENGDVNVHHMSSARLAVKTISGIPPSARDTGHTRLASSACAASYRHPCLLCPPGQTLTIQTTAGTHGAGPVTGNPVRFDCPPGSWRRGIRNVTAPSADGRDLAGAKHRQGLAPSRPAAPGDDASLPAPTDLVCLTVYEREAERQPRGPRLDRQLSCPVLPGRRVCHRLRPGGTVQQRRRPGRRGGFPGLDAPVRGPGATALTLTPLGSCRPGMCQRRHRRLGRGTGGRTRETDLTDPAADVDDAALLIQTQGTRQGVRDFRRGPRSRPCSMRDCPRNSSGRPVPGLARLRKAVTLEGVSWTAEWKGCAPAVGCPESMN